MGLRARRSRAARRAFDEANLACIRDRDPNQFFDMLKWAVGPANLGPSMWLPWFVGGYGSRMAGDGFYRFHPVITNAVGVWAEEQGETTFVKDDKEVRVTFHVKLIHDPGLPS